MNFYLKNKFQSKSYFTIVIYEYVPTAKNKNIINKITKKSTS